MFGWFKKKKPLSLTDELEELVRLQADADACYRKLIADGATAAPDDTEAWIAAGEKGYINCLLTALAEGSVNRVTVSTREPLPRVDALAEGNPSLSAWTSQLDFPYHEFSSNLVVEYLLESFDPWRNGVGILRTLVVRRDGSPMAVLFAAHRTPSADALTITVMRPGDLA